MSDISPRRRLLGRALIGASALALPLTASFSYAAAQAQDNAVPPPPPLPAPPAAVAPPAPPSSPSPEASERRVQRFVFRQGDRNARARARDMRRFAMRRDGREWPRRAWPQVRTFQFQGNPLDPEFQQRMEQYSHEMAEWSRKYGQQWEQWSRQFNGQWAERMRQWSQGQAERGRAQAQRFARIRPVPMPAPMAVPQPPQAPVAPLAPQAPRAWVAPRIAISPEALQRCRNGENGSNQVTLPDGRNQVIICNQVRGGGRGQALSSLRATRDRIARNNALSEDVRRDVLQDLDREIERLQREGDD